MYKDEIPLKVKKNITKGETKIDRQIAEMLSYGPFNFGLTNIKKEDNSYKRIEEDLNK